MRLQSLGRCEITVGRTRLTPLSERVFALALYLIVERGREIPRPILTRLLWPQSPEDKAAHSLRQAVYRLRQLGATIVANASTVGAAASSVAADYFELFESNGSVERSYLGKFLPGYDPDFSEEFQAWVDSQRSLVDAALRRAYVSSIAVARMRGDWPSVERFAYLCLELDCLNEEATLALAEANAVHGSKAKAIQILDDYLREVGASAREIRLPAVTLRNRITRTDASLVEAGRTIPLVGREQYLRDLNDALALARASHGSLHFIWGEPGIGKTRLLREFLQAARLETAHAVVTNTQSADQTRPLSCFLDALPALLGVPGSLGTSPEALSRLRSLIGPVPSPPSGQEDAFSAGALNRLAILELIDCLTDEQPLILAVEDAHWLDPLSLELLQQLADWGSTRRLLTLMTSRRDEVPRAWRAAGVYSIRVHELKPLNVCESRKLLHSVRSLLQTTVDDAHDDLRISASGGNPYHLTELALRAGRELPGGEVSSSMLSLIRQRLERLHGSSLRVLQATAVLGTHATIQRVLSVLQRPAEEMLESFDELEKQGLLESSGQTLSCRHELIASCSLAELGSTATRLLHLRAAEVLAVDQASEAPLAVLWATAEHWLLAGEHAVAVERLRTCAQQALRLGSPREAARTLRRAAELPQEVSAQVALLSDCAEILARSSQWADVADTLAEIQRINSNSPMSGRHDERELLLLESSWFAGTPAADILSSVRPCLHNDTDPVHRLMAAQLALRLCDNTAAADQAHKVYNRVRDLLMRADLPADLRLEVELVYHSSFGELQRSAVAAREWIAFWRQTPEDPRLIRALHWGALALQLSGYLEEARELALEAYRAASRRDLPARAGGAADALSDIMWHLGDLHQASAWADEGIAWCRRLGRGTMGSSVLMQGVRVAIAQNNYRVANELFRESEQLHGSSTQARADAWSLGVRLYLLVKHERKQPDVEAVNEFLRLFAETCHLSLMDHLCFIAYDLLRECHRQSEARELLVNFISHQRRGTYPLLPPLRVAAEAEGLQLRQQRLHSGQALQVLAF